MKKVELKKIIFLCVFLLSWVLLGAQDDQSLIKPVEKDAVNTESVIRTPYPAAINYESVDHYVLSLKSKYKTIPALANDLFKPFSTQQEKVRAIFMWIADNIAYDCVAYHKYKSNLVEFTYSSEKELAEKREKYYYDSATRVLQSKKAVCEGYAALFNALCKIAGIQSEVVIGTASNNLDKIKRLKERKNFSTNHTWNKVEIDGYWYYADVTWASGYCDPAVKHFYKEFIPYYYITPVDKLYETHVINFKITEKRNQGNN